jgi:hypothetical protein
MKKKIRIEELPINYQFISETGGEKRFISFCQSDFYQAKVLVNNFYKPVVLSKFKTKK